LLALQQSDTTSGPFLQAVLSAEHGALFAHDKSICPVNDFLLTDTRPASPAKIQPGGSSRARLVLPPGGSTRAPAEAVRVRLNDQMVLARVRLTPAAAEIQASLAECSWLSAHHSCFDALPQESFPLTGGNSTPSCCQD
jgi:hypothetical protein